MTDVHSAAGDWDLVVIGSGGAAMAAAITAREAERRVALVEAGTLGGTCVNVGCVPSKFALAASGTRTTAAMNPFRGVPTAADGVDLAALVAQKHELTAALRQHKYAEVAAAHGFPVLRGTGTFAGPEVLTVDGQRLRANRIVIATGAAPAHPHLPGLDDVDFLTSTTIMELTEVPDSLVVIGGGYVGLEQAQTFADLGSRVTLVGRLAPTAEPELREVMRSTFARHGITVVEQRATGVERLDHGRVAVVTDAGERVAAARLLVATGRRPVTGGLNLPAAAVDTDKRGFIRVDARQQTSNPRVFAAGDVTGARQFVYVAAATGRAAAGFALGLPDATGVDYAGLPSVTFTRPQLASAGLSEAEAVRAGYRCDCRTLPAADIPRALVNGDTLGALKIVADAQTGRVLGVHAALESAGEIMLAATYAIKAGMTVADLADSWAPYLTMSEALRLTAGLWRSTLPTSCCA